MESVKTLHLFVKDKLRRNASEKAFNILRATVKTRLREATHSRILGNLLEYDPGIRDSFLSKFLKEEFKCKDWSIFVEKNNMDIVLEDKLQENAIIIENKVNDACEQLGQIDRYVTHYREKLRYKNVYVLYLKREDRYGPSPYSWSRTNEECKLISISYKDDVRDWIKQLIGDYSDNERLAAALKSYKEYLDIMFNDDSEIMKEAENIIKELLHIDDSEEKAGDNAVKLEEVENELKLLMEACRSLRYECSWTDIQQKINNILNEYGLPKLTDMKQKGWDLPDAGIPFRLRRHETQFYAVVSYLNECYIGIINFSQAKEKNDAFPSIFKGMFENIGDKHYSTIRYPIWFKIENEKNLVDSYRKMIGVLKNKAEGESPEVIALGESVNN